MTLPPNPAASIQTSHQNHRSILPSSREGSNIPIPSRKILASVQEGRGMQDGLGEAMGWVTKDGILCMDILSLESLINR